MIIALFPNLLKNHTKKIAVDVRNFLQQKGINVVAEDEKAKELHVPPLSSIDVDQVNFLISLGGDGTMLRVLHRHPELKAPIIGINMGSLGFMADVPLEKIYPSLSAMLDNNYICQERLMIQGRINGL